MGSGCWRSGPHGACSSHRQAEGGGEAPWLGWGGGGLQGGGADGGGAPAALPAADAVRWVRWVALWFGMGCGGMQPAGGVGCRLGEVGCRGVGVRRSGARPAVALRRCGRCATAAATQSRRRRSPPVGALPPATDGGPGRRRWPRGGAATATAVGGGRRGRRAGLAAARCVVVRRDSRAKGEGANAITAYGGWESRGLLRSLSGGAVHRVY